MVILYIAPIVVLYVIYVLIAHFYRQSLHSQYEMMVKPYIKKLLIVIAHPDDEVMFFSPSIFNLIEVLGKDNVFLLCLSNGNFYGIGEQREKELFSSCRQLGIPRANVSLANHDQFKDDPKIIWEQEKLKEVIELTCENFGVDTILSFDTYGVSGHQNHKDVHKSVSALNKFTQFFLCDVNIIRKYCSIVDVLCTTVTHYFSNDSSYLIFINSPLAVLRSYIAMRCHKSQLVWYRKLYFLNCRYILVNHVRKIDKICN